jgi:hypothetical protein
LLRNSCTIFFLAVVAKQLLRIAVAEAAAKKNKATEGPKGEAIKNLFFFVGPRAARRPATFVLTFVLAYAPPPTGLPKRGLELLF